MRELLYFMASLAGAVVLTALAVLLRPESPVWRGGLWGGIGVFVACACWLALGYLRPNGNAYFLAGTAIGIALFIGFGAAFLFEPTFQSNGETTKPIHESLFNAQLQQVLSLQNFIGGKDEIDLRNLFDLIEVVNLNLLHNKFLILKKTDELSAIDARFAGGEDAMFPEAYIVTQDPKTLKTTGILKPGWIGVLKKTKKYDDNKRELEQYTSSMQMPSEILDKVRIFHFSILASIKTIFDVLNQWYKEDSNYVAQFDNVNSRYGSVIQNNIWKQINLKPLADDIVAATRKYLNVNNPQ
jgi:hypothetical protein